MDKEIALNTLISITNYNIGFMPISPSEFSDLAIKITHKTGRSISLSSIKRLWGYVKYDSFPSMTTLNILAQFNGYRSWAAFLTSDAVKTDDTDSGFLAESVVNSDNLHPGDRLMLTWNNSKSCDIEYLDGKRFRVNQSENIKLKPGDTFTLHSISIGLPIYITDIHRDGQRIPAYIGAKKGGISTILLIPNQSI